MQPQTDRPDLTPGELTKVRAALGAVIQAIDSGALSAGPGQRDRLVAELDALNLPG
jgi:hypothetical protein